MATNFDLTAPLSANYIDGVRVASPIDGRRAKTHGANLAIIVMFSGQSFDEAVLHYPTAESAACAVFHQFRAIDAEQRRVFARREIREWRDSVAAW